jgi:hypothetical protein
MSEEIIPRTDEGRIAVAWLDIVIDGTEPERLMEISAPSLHFRGALMETKNARDYVDALAREPVRSASYELTSIVEDPVLGYVCLNYRLTTPDGAQELCHEFMIKKGKVVEVGVDW